MANPVGPPGTWTQVFEDTFDGPGLNTSNWTAVQGVNNSNITTQASSVSVSGGTCNLVLAGMINSRPSINGWPGASNGPVLAVGGCVEASINWPGFAGNSPYNWPAWWVSGQSWPANGEEDIFESYNGTPSALNYHNASGANNGPFPSGNWCNSFHTYTLVRGQTTLQCWWDGVLVRSIARNDNGGPQSLIVFMANANTSSATAVAKVDYVRMWTPGGTGGSSPTVVTNAATGITDTAVTLNGTVNPNSLATTYQFEYGATTGYGTATPGSPGSAGSGNAAITESANVTGLTASTLYHYRLNATNSAGLTHGGDQAFTTQQAPGGGGGGGGGGSLPTLAYSNTATATSALSYRATPAVTTSGATTETTWSVTKQAGTVSGDWIFIYVFGGTASMACTGFTAKPDANGFGGLLYRLADGTEGSAFSITGLAGHVVSTLIATVAGAASTLDPATVGTPVSGGAATSIPVASITLANANDWCLWFAANENGFGGPGLAITPPSGFTSQATNGGAAGNATIMLADNETIGTGATGTKTGTFASSFYSGVMVGLTPAAGAGTLTSTSFTPQTSDIIVVKCVGEDAGITFNTPAGGGWTYTSQLSDTTASHVSARIYTAPVTLGGTPQTVAETPTWGAFSNALMTVELWRGAMLAATPATCDTRGTGAPSTTLTTVAANSVVSWAAGDWADVNGVSRVYNNTSATPTEDGYVFSTARMTAYSAYQSAVTAGSQTLGLTAPTGQTWTLAGIEIQSTGSGGGAGGGVLSYRAAPAVTASSGNVSSWTVTKQAGTSSGDWIFIYLFGCDYSTAVACTGFTVTEDSLGFGALLYRLADGTESSTFTITGLGGAGPATTVIATIAGATTALDPNVVPVPNAGGPATAIPVNGITLGQAGDWLLWFAGNQNSFTGPGYAISAPPGFTSQATNGAAAANATVMLADSESPGTGATGAKTGTASSSTYWSGVMVGVTAGTPTGPSSSPGAQPATAAGTARNATVTTSGAAKALAGLAAGTGLAIQPAAVLSGSATPTAAAATAAGTALNATVQASPGIVWFPAKTLGVTIELLLNNVWTDITTSTYLRNPVQISGMGRADWTSQIQAAQATLTLNNRDGRFSPKNSAGAFFPFIARNTQIRISVNAQSATGAAYSGVRFWGEVAEWPVRWSAGEHDIYVDVVANGIWRRMSQLATTLGSAYTRYNALTLTGTSQPRCYWPMEDGTGSGQLVPYDSTAGTQNAVQSFITGQAGLSLAACSDFKGSDGIPQLNGASITATVPAGGTPTVNCTRFLLSVPAAGDSAQGTTAGNIAEIDSTGTVAKFEVYLNPAAQGTLLMHLVNSSGAIIASGTTTTNIKGKPVLVSCELVPSGGDVAFALRIIAQGASGITESLTGTLTGASVGTVTTVKFSRANVLADTAVGHLSVTYGTVPLMVPAAYALGGYAGEKAMDRFTRICGEMGITTQTIGVPSTTAAMGPQVDDTLTGVLQSVEDTDCGLLYETRDQFGLGYRSNASMANQVISAQFSYPAATLDTSLAPTYDDSLTRNNITVTNWTGYAQQAILTAGPMSVLNPPNGIGNGYALTRTVNAAADGQLPGIATFLLGQGTVDEIRFPVVTLKMARASNAALFTAVPGLRIGDYFQITNPPAFLTGTNIRQLAWGYSETLSAKQWDFSFNSVPETPWETGFSPGTIQTAQIPGGAAVTSAAPGAGGLGGIIANGSITPAMLSGGITVHTLGGNAITLSSGPPANPNTGDIWIDSDTGLLSQWTGTAWIPFKLDASQVIQAGTIVSANIAASAITSGLIAAGTVAAGIVDATNILANTYVATSSSGEFLAYDVSTPTTGHLVNSIAGAAGTDNASNPFPEGFFGQQLTLASQGSAPPTFAGSSVLYTSSAGRLRYISQGGADLVLDRSALNLSNFTMTTQTTPHVMSGALSYLANEAIVGSEYEVEIDGTVTSPTVTAVQFTFDFFLDGAAINAGSGIDVGAVVMQTGLTYAYTLRARATVQTTGAGGTVNCALDGGMTRKVSGVGNTSQFTTLNNVVVNCAFDTTSNHSLAIYCHWAGTPSSGSAITYRTKITRRY